LSALGVAVATSAQTQVYVEPPRGYVEPPPQMVHGGLPPNEILMAVRASGLRPLTQPARRGPQYVLLASDNMGGQLRVVVSAHNGRILNAAPAYDPRFAYEPSRPRGLVPIAPPQHASPQYAPPPPDLRTPSSPPPRTARAAPSQAPAAPQNHNLAGAPDVAPTAPARATPTPLPRPRPAIASNDAAAAPAAASPAPARETSPESEQPAARPPAAAPSAAPAQPAAETPMVPVAPLD
jgi:hypothetical protein